MTVTVDAQSLNDFFVGITLGVFFLFGLIVFIAIDSGKK